MRELEHAYAQMLRLGGAQVAVHGFPADAKLLGQICLWFSQGNPAAQFVLLGHNEGAAPAFILPCRFGDRDALALALKDQGSLKFGHCPE